MRATYLMGAAALLAVSAAQSRPGQNAPRLDDLAWLSGTWANESADGWSEEVWMAPRGGMMLGMNRLGKGDQASMFEFMRIAVGDGGRISYWASPRGKPAVEFPLVSVTPRGAVFENARHDYPTRIVYRLEGNTLTGTISGPGGKNPHSWTFKRR